MRAAITAVRGSSIPTAGDEGGQAANIREVLEIFDREGVLEGRHGATYPDMTWEPKAAFTAVADCYRG
jgi:hypothetical protein